MHPTRLVLIAILLALLVTPLFADEPDLNDLTSQADAIIAGDNVEARPKVDTIFKLADLLADKNQLDRAIHYYKAALTIQPHDFAHHLRYAKVLEKQSHRTEAREQAQIVAHACENAKLVEEAREFLGLPPVSAPALGALPPGTGNILVLIPMGDVDFPLLADLQKELQDATGLETTIRSVTLHLPPPARDPTHPIAVALRKSLAELRQRDESTYNELLQRNNLRPADLADDLKMLDLGLKTAEQTDDAENLKTFKQQLFTAWMNRQWDAEELVAELNKATAPYTQANVRFLAITPDDIFTHGNNFLFGYLTGNIAVVSYHRFASNFTGEIPNRPRLLSRTFRQCLSSAGKVFGIPACTDPDCPRAYRESLAEHDARSEVLCSACREQFARLAGHSAAPPISPAVVPPPPRQVRIPALALLIIGCAITILGLRLFFPSKSPASDTPIPRSATTKSFAAACIFLGLLFTFFSILLLTFHE